MPVGSNLTNNLEINHNMASYRRNKSGGTQTEGPSNSSSPTNSVVQYNPSTTQGINNNAPKYGTLIPNRIFVGGISSNTTESELCQLFSKYGNVKATKIIADRAGVSKGYGFVTFDTEEEVRCLIQDSNNIVLKERKLNIAPAVKKQSSFSRPFDAATPPPASQYVCYHNGVPYTFHNGMAYFPPNPHQPAIAALPPTADSPIYQPFGPAQNITPSAYGAPILVPTHSPMYMQPNYSYPLPMTNGVSAPFIYTGSGSGNVSSGTGTSDNNFIPSPATPQFFQPQYPPVDTFYTQPMIFVPYNGEFDPTEQQTVEGHSSTATTPHSDGSDRSSDSPANNTVVTQHVNNTTRQQPQTPTPTDTSIKQTNVDSQVPVVSWKHHAEEREMFVRDGRRAFYPIPQAPPQPPNPQAPQQFFILHQPTFQGYPGQGLVGPKQNQAENYGQRPPFNRGRPRSAVPANNVPFIPKYPASFNNNNPLALNNNYHDKKVGDLSNGKCPRYLTNRVRVGNNRVSHNGSPPNPPNSNPTNSFRPESCPSPQVMQQFQNHTYERQHGPVATNAGFRWHSNQQMTKRMPFNKRINGPTQNNAVTANTNIIRLAKKPQPNVEGDYGGGGDAQQHFDLALTPPGSPTAIVDATSKTQ